MADVVQGAYPSPKSEVPAKTSKTEKVAEAPAEVTEVIE